MEVRWRGHGKRKSSFSARGSSEGDASDPHATPPQRTKRLMTGKSQPLSGSSAEDGASPWWRARSPAYLGDVTKLRFRCAAATMACHSSQGQARAGVPGMLDCRSCREASGQSVCAAPAPRRAARRAIVSPQYKGHGTICAFDVARAMSGRRIPQPSAGCWCPACANESASELRRQRERSLRTLQES